MILQENTVISYIEFLQQKQCSIKKHYLAQIYQQYTLASCTIFGQILEHYEKWCWVQRAQARLCRMAQSMELKSKHSWMVRVVWTLEGHATAADLWFRSSWPWKWLSLIASKTKINFFLSLSVLIFLIL